MPLPAKMAKPGAGRAGIPFAPVSLNYSGRVKTRGGSTRLAQAATASQFFAYHPASLTVRAGDTVVWKNEDMVAHTVTAANRSFDSGNIAPGATWKLVVKKTGTFPYICTYHPNMHGVLIVQ